MKTLKEHLQCQRYIKELRYYGIEPNECRGKSANDLRDYLRKEKAKDKRWLG